MDAEYINENEIIAQLGIDRKKLRRLRPDGFKLTDEDGALWPLPAATSLALQCGVTLSLSEKNAPQIEKLRVVSIASLAGGQHFANPQIIQAQRENSEVVHVRVTHSKNWRPTLRVSGEPMYVRAVKSEHGNVWLRVGNEPRSPGQW